MSRDPAAMKEEEEDTKSAPRGSPQRDEDQQHKQSSPTMQTAPAHHQQQQHQHYYVAPNPQQQQQQHHQQQHAADFRASPAASAAMSLPSIQHFEGGHMPPQQPPYMPTAQMNGAQPMMHAPYNPNLVPYQSQPMPPTMPSNAPNGQNGGMLRYPIPPQTPMDARNMSGGRHKKEIKRRTKTGCLTCRKRRIKCDEGHPTCRNCHKSKRECLGYDPVFRPQPSPANIQPAPTLVAPQRKESASQQGASNLYQPYQDSTGAFVSQSESEGQPLGPHDSPNTYHNPLDPALSIRHPDLPEMHVNRYAPRVEPVRRVRKLAMDELFTSGDTQNAYEPRDPTNSSTPQTPPDLEQFYRLHYAPGLDRLFETNWYATHGFSILSGDRQLQDLAAQCMEQMQSNSTDYQHTRSTSSLEARLVWSLASMPRSHGALESSNGSFHGSAKEASARVRVMEVLLNGNYLAADSEGPPQPAPVTSSSEEANRKYNQEAFWYHLGNFVAVNDEGEAHSQKDADAMIQGALASMRVLLNMLENRDVLYSIAIARHIGGRMPEWSPQHGGDLPPPGSNPTDDENDVHKLGVAVNFVRAEEQKGTNQVIQRICGLALRAWTLQKKS